MEILQIFYHELGKSPRPTRFYKELCKVGDVTVCSCLESKKLMQGGELYELSNLKPSPFKINSVKRTFHALTRQFEKAIWIDELKEPFESLKEKQFQLIVCQDILALPLAAKVKNLPQNKGRCKLIMDLREFFPLDLEQFLMWRLRWKRLMIYICKTYLPHVDTVFTVSPGLARGYDSWFGTSCKILPNLPYYHANLAPRPTENLIRCIHHGDACPGRKLEYMIEGFIPLKGKYVFDLMLMPTDRKYYEKLKKLTTSHEHINIIPPVQMDDIVSFIAQYDLGVYLSTDISFNEKYAWPNKFFEFIQARLGLVVSPAPDMANFVNEKKIGVSTHGYMPESLTATMLTLTTKVIDLFKVNSHSIAKELCWERNTEILQSHLEEIKQYCSKG